MHKLSRISISISFIILFTLELQCGAQLDTEKTSSKSSRSYKLRASNSRGGNSSSSSFQPTARVSTSRSMSEGTGGDLSPSSDDSPFDHVAEESRDDWTSTRGKFSSPNIVLPSIAPRHSYPSGGSAGGSSAHQPVYSSYPYGAYSNYQNYYAAAAANPLLDTYPYYERERAARELAARVPALSLPSPGALSAAASSIFPSIQPFDLESYGDALALASGHGWGWSKDHKDGHESHDYINHYVSKVNTNAIGLLGLLGLLSLLSNVLLLLTTTTTTTTAAAGRRKRSTPLHLPQDGQEEDQEESGESKRQRIFSLVLPYLAPVAHVTDRRIPSDCALQGVCLTNRLLVKEYGLNGRPAGSRITSAIVQLLAKNVGEQGIGSLGKRIEEAGLKGRNQKDCHLAYPVCKALEEAPLFPFMISVDQLPSLLQKAKQVTSYSP